MAMGYTIAILTSIFFFAQGYPNFLRHFNRLGHSFETRNDALEARQSLTLTPSTSVGEWAASIHSRFTGNFQHSSLYIENIFTSSFDGGSARFNISVPNCMQLGSVAGPWTFSDGSDKDNATLLDIVTDLTKVSNSGVSQSLVRQQLSSIISTNLQLDLASANTSIARHICNWTDPVPTPAVAGDTYGNVELRKLMQFDREQAILDTLTIVAFVVGGSAISYAGGNLISAAIDPPRTPAGTPIPSTKDDLPEWIFPALELTVLLSALAFYQSFAMQHQLLLLGEAFVAAIFIAWHRRFVLAMSLNALVGALPVGGACVPPDQVNEVLAQVADVDDENLGVVPFAATDQDVLQLGTCCGTC